MSETPKHTVAEDILSPGSKWERRSFVIINPTGRKVYGFATPHRHIAEQAAAGYDRLPAGYTLQYSYTEKQGLTTLPPRWVVSKGGGHTKSPEYLRSHDEDIDVVIGIAQRHAAAAPKRAEQAAIQEAETALREAQAAIAAERGPLATPPQVDHIMRLLARREYNGDGGGFIIGGPATRGEVARLTKAEASLYIDSLKEDY